MNKSDFMKEQEKAHKKELEQIIISLECSKFWDTKGRDDFKVVLAQPDKLKTLKLSAGLQIVADYIHKTTNVQVDFASLYDEELMNLFGPNDNTTTLFNEWNVSDSDIIGIGISNPCVVGTFFNFLDKSKVPILKEQRILYHDPFIIAGGLGVTNSSPLESFIDAFVIGEGSIAASELVTKYQRAKERNLSEKELYKSLTEIPGVYVPEYSKNKVRFQTINDVKGVRRASLLMSKDKALIFADYSCKFKCSFCQMSNVRGSYSFQGLDNIKEYLTEFDGLGVENATIAGGSVTNIQTEKLIELFAWTKKNLSRTTPVIRSVRIDDFPKIFDYLEQGEIHIAPETGSDYLRKNVLLKNFSNEQILKNLELVASKVSHVRMYHIVGIPTETEEHREMYSELVGNVSEILSKYHSENEIEIYSYPLLSQLGTPLENYGIIGLERFKLYVRQFRNSAATRIHDSTTLNIYPLDPLWHLFQGLANTGGKEVGAVLHEGYLNGNTLEAYMKVCDDHGLKWRDWFGANPNASCNLILLQDQARIDRRKQFINKSILRGETYET